MRKSIFLLEGSLSVAPARLKCGVMIMMVLVPSISRVDAHPMAAPVIRRLFCFQ